jgi:predicted enzyme related to lactoylglutathione lyase
MKTNAAFTGISVNDSEKAKDFYTRVLGLDLSSEAMGLHFRLPFGGMLFIYEKPDHQPATYTALNFVVEDIDAAVDELVEKGVVFEVYDNLFPGAEQDEKGILRSPDPIKYGPSIAWFKDPAGNTIAILQDDN